MLCYPMKRYRLGAPFVQLFPTLILEHSSLQRSDIYFAVKELILKPVFRNGELIDTLPSISTCVDVTVS